KINSIKSSTLFKGATGAAAVVAITCAVNSFGDSIAEYNLANVVRVLIGLSGQFISAGSQVQAMQVINMAEIASINQPLTDSRGAGWAAAEGVKDVKGE